MWHNKRVSPASNGAVAGLTLRLRLPLGSYCFFRAFIMRPTYTEWIPAV